MLDQRDERRLVNSGACVAGSPGLCKVFLMKRTSIVVIVQGAHGEGNNLLIGWKAAESNALV